MKTTNRISNERAYGCELVQHPEGAFKLWKGVDLDDSPTATRFRPEWPRGAPETSRMYEMVDAGMLVLDHYFRKLGKFLKE